MLDSPNEIMKKFKRAVTDSEARVCIGEDKLGINNLIGIYSAVTGKTADQIAAEFEGKGYGDFKTAVGEAVVEELRPIRERYEAIIKDKAALEALSIVAYKQPVTKTYIEQVRGVDCTGIISTLIQRELIEECGRLDAPGRPILYQTTPNFLRCFGLESLDELPGENSVQLTLDEDQNGDL